MWKLLLPQMPAAADAKNCSCSLQHDYTSNALRPHTISGPMAAVSSLYCSNQGKSVGGYLRCLRPGRAASFSLCSCGSCGSCCSCGSGCVGPCSCAALPQPCSCATLRCCTKEKQQHRLHAPAQPAAACSALSGG